MKKLFLILMLMPAAPAFSKGHLFILGGGERPDQLMARFVELAGGTSAGIVIIPMASQEPEEAARLQKAQFTRLGVRNAESLVFAGAEADSGENILKVKKASGVYFTGGDQNRLTAVLLGTKLLGEIRAVYERGGVIGGTSAGAAVMSRVMIIGDERRYPGVEDSKAFQTIQSSNVMTAEGFGFTDKAIVDQHFLRKYRHNRLISLVLENPALPGIGIDESTALIIYPDDICEVAGESSVVIYDASHADNIMTGGNGHLSAENLAVHILADGGRYDLKSRRVIRRIK
jgi:cyanophycinase